jgi:hypothetical protein
VFRPEQVRAAVTPPRWPEALRQVSADYADAFGLRAAMQAVPVLGSAIDTLLAGLGTQLQSLLRWAAQTRKRHGLPKATASR